jgi:hypothetical protein
MRGITMKRGTKPERADFYDANIPGCRLRLPLLEAKDYQTIIHMIDNPNEYSVEELATALDETILCLEKAEGFIVSMHQYLDRMRAVWRRWIHVITHQPELTK